MATSPSRSSRRLSPLLLAAALVAAAVVGGVVGAWWAGGDDDPRPSAVDVGFLRDMIRHHDQAVEMAMLALNNDPGAEVRGFALDVLRLQQRERGVMEALLARWGEPEATPDAPAMAWMGMPVPLAAMPGYQPVAALDALAEASGEDLEVRFLTMMRDHHAGGVHMAEAAAERATLAEVRALAERQVRVQRAEMDDYERALEAADPPS